MIQVVDNFNYRGKKPNFDRDSFDTLQDMKNYSENSLDDGHISYCKETDKHYKFNSNNQSDPTTGKWVEQHEAVPADEEDITEQNGTLQLANKTYDKQSFSGLGRVYLRKNIVGDKNVLTQAMINKANTIYVIQYDYDLKEASINIPENCVLQFDGGSLSNGTITGNGTSIDSIPIYIFKDIIFEGTFKGEFYVEYMGASIKNEDNSGYFNKAFSSVIKHWVANSSFYKISNTIIINNNSFFTFKCIGEIIVTKGIDAFKFIGKYNNNIVFDVYAIKTDEPPISSDDNHTQYDYDDLAGSAITIASNFYNSTIKIGYILYFKYGLHMSIDSAENFHIGIQYMKFYFQNIECTTCIFFDYKDNSRKGWINENQFFGGRLTGNYGILTTDIDFFDVINSNNFYKIGFEGVNTCAIKLSGVNKWKLNDLRMHESIYNKPYIILNDCKVHYSIGNNSNYRTYTINPGISIIMETEIENITMFPAGNNRPDMPVVGYQYFDTTINKPIFYDGSKWIDATGATV